MLSLVGLQDHGVAHVLAALPSPPPRPPGPAPSTAERGERRLARSTASPFLRRVATRRRVRAQEALHQARSATIRSPRSGQFRERRIASDSRLIWALIPRSPR